MNNTKPTSLSKPEPQEPNDKKHPSKNQSGKYTYHIIYYIDDKTLVTEIR